MLLLTCKHAVHLRCLWPFQHHYCSAMALLMKSNGKVGVQQCEGIVHRASCSLLTGTAWEAHVKGLELKQAAWQQFEPRKTFYGAVALKN